ncbi:tRNA pseudouridine32 synthase / 23S rRNA pseudouridine746 synthase [Nocardia amikacinitolerans]|uniref:RNA pseudouridylate synthase n=1 Tax=Nocardia amikacinitolerans TaxID=756689 RepID=A0A285LSM0_9NOCA|nr:RluA family pseudouridine synthase [Nocardia amikacinitolerans]MCP2295673.1 tRNA pseudouridine32 synthase / 23S rRNA pseudouridine746 synthase [Nocardia amikacinitolerans]MCP2317506.1 tRNA pseudouridine32 synthase / 23S rRNA pseudouridine746 synthase [Nocardia amikacinitolerans]SNY87885.1 tRNA pseudouridine32 synthase / 23S rRNA pseudouridine746 synthase [Nocardia amikacinitolerans]
MRRRQQPPLPKRYGLDPARLRLPETGEWATIRDHLVERLPRVAPERIDELLHAGGIVDLEGPIAPDAPYVPGGAVWFHRDLPDETDVPFDITVVHRDEDLLVVDKPHFLATIPRGQHIRQTALVRLREELGLPDLVPAHRLDRVTAGLLLFVVNPARRGAYQTMFHRRAVRKEYEAIAPYRPDLELPRTVRSRIVKEKQVLAAQEVEGEPNAETRVDLLEHRAGLGRYRLRPLTGRTHQLRLHMNGLGVPILGDDFYPVLTDKPVHDFTRPLQLLAASLEFTDPVSGKPRRFETTRSLQAWTDHAGWAG